MITCLMSDTILISYISNLLCSSFQTVSMASKFVLQNYKPLDKETVGFWYDIVDIVGPVRNWLPKIRNLFFARALLIHNVSSCVLSYM